jgi:hypothetical protein
MVSETEALMLVRSLAPALVVSAEVELRVL